jgi:predicted metal-dependent phosphoesterase TrpH
MLIDRHVHTTAPPGHATVEPDTLLRSATEHGVDGVSVPDHTSVALVPAALDAADGVRPRPAAACAACLQRFGILA